MRWMITDSGLGGLSVCAGFEQAISTEGHAEPIELLYVNATPDDRIGYNALATQAERIALFDRFLQASTARFAPDRIIIACNTLSVLYDQTHFAAGAKIPVQGIVQAGVDLCLGRLAESPERDLLIFATETTTEANTYPRMIGSTGAAVIPQACPELAHAISNDASGAAAGRLLSIYVREAVRHLDPESHSVFAFLGCTHYGYQARVFVDCLAAVGVDAISLDPNQRLVETVMKALPSVSAEHPAKLSIRFISRYQIPEVEIKSMAVYLAGQAPLTLAALQSHSILPTLFELP